MIANLQLLRAFAAINVVFHHVVLTSLGYQYEPVVFRSFLGWGENGVDIFFVISGFVMMYTQMRKKRTIKEFYTSRIIRIVPIYWFVTTVVLVIFIALPQLLNELTLTPSWTLSSYLFLSSVIEGRGPIVYLGWTLEWEMFFYMVFGFSLLFPSRALSVGFVFAVLICVAVFFDSYIVLEFLGGMAVAYVYKTYRVGKAAAAGALLVGSVLLVATLIEHDVRAIFVERVLYSGIPALLIVFGAVYLYQASNRLLIFLGDASYSIYLVQMLSIPAFYKVASAAGINLNTDVMAVLCLLCTIVAGSVMYLVIEGPATRALRSRVAKRRAPLPDMPNP